MTNLDITKLVRIDYTNWRGERKVYLINPTGKMEFTSTEKHPDKQWLFEAVDMNGGKIKMFAMKDVHTWTSLKTADTEVGIFS